VWRHTKDVTALREMLTFFRGVYGDSPPLQKAFLVAHVCNLTAAEKVERIHELVPSPFELIDNYGGGELTVAVRSALRATGCL